VKQATLLVAILLALAAPALAKNVTLGWDPAQNADIAGYRLHYGSGAGSYNGSDALEGPSPIDVGFNVTTALSGLDDTKSHFFAVTAYTFSGEESGFSNEVRLTADLDFDFDGYTVAVDCNDNDPLINPGAQEIIGNGIDENCNGMDDDVKSNLPPGAIEAESGNLIAPMSQITDPAVAGGVYIETASNNAGTATYSVNTPSPGVYKIVGRVFAANDGSDSFFVNIDNLGEFIWDLNPTSVASDFSIWRDDEVTNRGNGTYNNPEHDPYTVELTQGNHTIAFKGREASVKLDYFSLVKVGEVSKPVDDLDYDGYRIPTDCDDNNPLINPGAIEFTYNGVDENCNGMGDDDDLDKDGYQAAEDCNDNDPTINPGAIEVPYNGVDENCNGMGDDDDLDKDGYKAAEDCNDNDPTINPGATEIQGNSVDENCNGNADDVKSVLPSGAIEAEAGILNAPMRKTTAPAVASGAYIETTTVNAGTATYSVNITSSGIYKIVSRVFAANDGSDSFFVNIDNQGEFIWDLNPTSTASDFNVWRDDEVTNRGNGTYNNPEYDAYTVALGQGTHTITFRGREPNVKLDYFLFTKLAELPSGPVTINAESGILTAPMQSVSDVNASGDSYIESNQNNSGTATYSFQVNASGAYKIVARVFAVNDATDSFFVNIDNQGEFIWDLNPTAAASEFNVWRDDEVTNRGNGTFNSPQYDPYTVQLGQGTHTITIRTRERNAKLDKLTFVKM
jgi:hypothetical protein